MWMILMQLVGTKAKAKVIQSPAKLWLLSASDRNGLFSHVENISLRLNFYPFIAASILLSILLVTNPDLLVHGVAVLSLSLLFMIAMDYWVGMVLSAGNVSMVLTLVSKMIFMAVMINIHLDLVWYVLLAVVLFISCLLLRKRAQRNFLVANLSAANSSARAS
jgi:hypothetical protein